MAGLFDTLGERLSQGNIGFLLIGGRALQAYGIVRQTLDVDWLATDGDIGKIKEIMRGEGYRVVSETASFLRFRHKATGVIDVDVLLVDAATFGAIDKEARATGDRSRLWRVPCPAHLVALKLHAIKNDASRESRDAADIIELIRVTGGQVSDETLRGLCERYGPDGIYERIQARL